MKREHIVVGIDPSSRRLAAVVTTLGEPGHQVYTRELPPKMPAQTCLLSYVWLRNVCALSAEYVMDFRDPPPIIHCYLEAPISAGAKGGVRALIPQAQVSGALLAAGTSMEGVSIELVGIQSWKKAVVGKGNATKAQVREWAANHWTGLYTGHAKDQDVLDAAAINRYGDALLRKKMNDANT